MKRLFNTVANIWVYLAMLAAISIICVLKSGAASLDFKTIFATLHATHDSTAELIIWQLRLPLAINGFIVGGLLALAGVLMQTLLRNPLADPYVLGVSGGASVFVLISLLIGVAPNYNPIAALIGASCSTLLVFFIAYKNQWSATTLLLTGVIIAIGWSAMISFLLTISSTSNLPGILFWLMGNLRYQAIAWPGLIILIISALYGFYLAPSLNLLAEGESSAATLGVNTKSLQLKLFFICALLTGYAVSIAGNIGFIGLIIPHFSRRLVKNNHRFIIPTAIILGGSLMCFSLSLARSLLSPIVLPVGVVMAIIGVPSFLFILQAYRRPYHD